MRIASFQHQGHNSFGIVQSDRIRDCGHFQERWSCLADVLRDNALNELADVAQSAPTISLAEVEFLPVVPHPAKIICVGTNYAEHLEEAGALVRAAGKRPVVFFRLPECQVGHEGAILRPLESSQLDFEGELAVIIGKEGRRIAAERAFEHVAGYTIFNDVTLRDYQMHTTQFTSGKNFPATGASGPWMVTKDEIPDPSALTLTTRLNGKVMQQSSTSKLIFSIPQIIASVSEWTVLRPGDVISTGTPAGVAMFRTPPTWMKNGDKIEVEISQIGLLRNTVVDEARANN